MGARASQLLWTGELGADPRWGMRAAVAVLVSCSVLHLLRPWTLCVSAASGQFGPKGPVRGYGMSRAQIAKRVLADVFLYLIVVCSMSKKSLFPWQISRTEFLIHFQDPIRAGGPDVIGADQTDDGTSGYWPSSRASRSSPHRRRPSSMRSTSSRSSGHLCSASRMRG